MTGVQTCALPILEVNFRSDFLSFFLEILTAASKASLLKGALRLKFWWIVKELRRRFEEGNFLGQAPNRLSRLCASATLVLGWFGDFQSIINFKINFFIFT